MTLKTITLKTVPEQQLHQTNHQQTINFQIIK
jgi:hypothetical protein